MKLLLLSLPEVVTIFIFMLVMFYSITEINIIKLVASFAGIFAIVALSDLLSNELLSSGIILVGIAVLWTVINKGIEIKYFGKAVLNMAILLIGMLLIQVWIPIYFVISGTSSSILDDTMTQFLYSIPCRLIEYLIIFLIFKKKLLPLLADILSDGVSRVANKAAATITIWWVYEPKVPKSIRRWK